jgi:hypothetical protein
MHKISLFLVSLPALGLLVAFSMRPASAPISDTHRSDDFKKFLKQFDKTPLPFVLSASDLQAQLAGAMEKETTTATKKNKSLRLDDPSGFLPFDPHERMSRMPTYYAPVAQLAAADHIAVVYTSFRGFSRSYKTYTLIVFDKAGNFISRNRIAETTPEFLTEATVDAGLRAIVQTYRIHRDTADEYDASDTISSLTLETSKEIDLTAPTEIEEDFWRKPVKKPATDLPTTESLGAR